MLGQSIFLNFGHVSAVVNQNFILLIYFRIIFSDVKTLLQATPQELPVKELPLIPPPLTVGKTECSKQTLKLFLIFHLQVEKPVAD